MIVREFLYQSLEMIGYSDAVLDRAQDVNGISYTNHCDELFTRILCSIGRGICARSGAGFVWDLCSLGHRICMGFVLARARDLYGISYTNYCVRPNRIPDYPPKFQLPTKQDSYLLPNSSVQPNRIPDYLLI